jgi:hypothetical protein
MQSSRRYQASESSQPSGPVGARRLRRVKGSSSLSVRIPERQTSSQATAPSTRPPPIWTDQTYPSLGSPVLPYTSTEQQRAPRSHRHISVVDGAIHVPGILFSPQQQAQTPQSSPPVNPRNVLRKMPPPTDRPSAKKVASLGRLETSKFLGISRNSSKRCEISEPANPVHLSGSSSYAQPLVRIPEFVPEESKTSEAQRFSSMLPRTALTAESDVEIRQPSLPLRCHPVNIEIVLTPAPNPPELSEPRSPKPSIASSNHSAKSNLTVSHSWQVAYHLEHRQACCLETLVKAAEANLNQDRARADRFEREYNILLAETVDPKWTTDAKLRAQAIGNIEKVKEVEARCIGLENEMIQVRVEASRNRKYADHYRMLYEREVTRNESLRQPLGLRSQTGDSVLPNETGKLPVRGPLAPSLDSAHELSAISWLENLHAPSSAPQEEDGEVETHELSTTSSHETLHPSPEEESVSDSLESETKEIPYELPELASLRCGFNDLFVGADKRSQQSPPHRKNDEASPSPTSLELAELAELVPEKKNQISTPVRSREVIYRFGSPKIEATAAVYRMRICWSSAVYTPPSPIAEAVLRMDSWEWCSVPDLKLTDPRNP